MGAVNMVLVSRLLGAWLASVLWVALFAAPLFSQTAKVGSLVVLEHPKDDDARYMWLLVYPEEFEQFAVEGRKLFFAMPDRAVKFNLLKVPNDTKKPIESFPHKIVPDTSPKPEPIGNSDDSSDDGFGSLRSGDAVSLVYESDKPDFEIARIRESTFWQITLPAKGYKRPIAHDIDSKEGLRLKKLAAESLPFFCVERDGEIVKVFKAKTVEEFREDLGL